MHTLWIIARKDLRLLFTDKVAVFFTFMFPLLFAVLFGSMMGGNDGPRRIRLAIIQEDTHADTQAFVATLQAAPELNVTLMDAAAAEAAVRQGKQSAWLKLPAGFGERYGIPFGPRAPQVQLGVDPARSAETGMLEGVLMRYASARFERVFSPGHAQKTLDDTLAQMQRTPDMPAEWRDLLGEFLPRMAKLASAQSQTSADQQSPATTAASAEKKPPAFTPLAVEHVDMSVEKRGPGNVYAVLFPQAIIWGSLGCLMAFGSSLVQERTQGTLLRLLTAPISDSAVLLGKAGACFLSLLTVNILLLLLARLLFKVALPDLVMLAVAVLALCSCFAGLMMLLAALAPTEQAVNGMGWAVFMVLGMIGGSMIPLFLLPEWLQQVSHISPIKWAILALEGAIWRQFSVAEMALPVGVLMLVGAASSSLGVWRFRQRKLASS